jgi:hypothetical protein
MIKSIEIHVISEYSPECLTRTIYWESIDELKEQVDNLNSFTSDIFENQCYWEWNEDECTEEENKIIEII